MPINSKGENCKNGIKVIGISQKLCSKIIKSISEIPSQLRNFFQKL